MAVITEQAVTKALEAVLGGTWRPERECRGHLVVTAAHAPGRGPRGVASGEV